MAKAAKVAKLSPESSVNGLATNGVGGVNGANGLNGHVDANGNGVGTPVKQEDVNGYGGYEDVGMAEGYGYEAGEGGALQDPEDDPIVYGACTRFAISQGSNADWNAVNGKPVPYSKVTEEDHELMTPDEYTAYFEIMQSRS